jgi:Protein of unknown function DUF262/Protein of unknown function (DUF1524)
MLACENDHDESGYPPGRMQAETRTLTHLFQLDVRYVVPLYQRPYVWTRERQWQPLWEDIQTVANHVLTEGASSKSPSHFLGAIVVQQQDNPPGTPQRFLVIDGQQRLTTLQIAICAAARTAADMAAVDEAELLIRLTYNNPRLAKGDEIFKVWPTNANRRAFNIVMRENGNPEDADDDPSNEIQEAYTFFRDQIALWAGGEGSGGGEVPEPAEHFAALRVTLSDLLKVVAIHLEDGDNAQVIFETLNGRGTPLIALDLLKNAVFLTAANENADTDALYHDHWAPELDQDYWRVDRSRGRLFTKNGDLFLQYWLVLEIGEPVAATELFDIFRREVLQPASSPPMTELIPTLARDAKILRELYEAPLGSPERRFLDLLDLLDTSTLMPLALLLTRSEEVTAERRANAFRVLESFLMRRMICGWTTRNYNRLVAGLVSEVKKELQHADEVLRKRLAVETAPANRWPRDDDVRGALLSKDIYGQRRRDRLVGLLWRIEEELRARDNKVEPGLAAPANLTIEHLIPQSWEEHWPLDETQQDPAAWRAAHIHRIGNLTLTTGALNSSLSNGPWHSPKEANDKRRALVKHSLLKLNMTVAHNHPEQFDEHSVDQRGTEFAEMIIGFWPGPDSEESESSAARSAELVAELDMFAVAKESDPSVEPTLPVVADVAELITTGVDGDEPTDRVVARRLAFLPDDKRREAAARFAAGEPTTTLAAEYGLTPTRAAYCLRQELVSSGQEQRIDPDDIDAIREALRRESLAWVACRTGLATSRLKALLDESESA